MKLQLPFIFLIASQSASGVTAKGGSSLRSASLSRRMPVMALYLAGDPPPPELRARAARGEAVSFSSSCQRWQSS